MSNILNINYEKFSKLIPENKRIISKMKDIINKNIKNKSLVYDIKKDKKDYEYISIKRKSCLYKHEHWFYKSKSFIGTCCIELLDLYSCILLTLYSCGSVNSYNINKNINVLLINITVIKNIIKKILNPLIKKRTNHENYYSYIKKILEVEFNIQNHQLNFEKNNCTTYFLIFISLHLGYDGIVYLNNSNIIKNNIKVVINNSSLLTRNTEDKYDWINWNIEDYILPIDEFELNTDFFSFKNLAFSLYDFYRDNRNPSIKFSEDYDIGTLNINNLISINKHFDKDVCMKKLIKFIKKYKLKIMCIQDIEFKTTKTFNKFLRDEDLYSTIADFEEKYFKPDELCNAVISTSNLIVLDNFLLPNSHDHAILFKHPNYKKTTFLNVIITKEKNMIEKLNSIISRKADYIIGNINILKGSEEFYLLNSSGYISNSDQIYSTDINGNQTDYILVKTPNVIKSLVTINYKYSTHKCLIGKL